MRRITLRYVLVLAILSVCGIVIIQIYWFSRAFNIRENQFNQSVNVALRNVADQLLTYANRPIPLVNPVEQLTSNYYVVMVNAEIHPELLETALINEFKLRELKLNFEYGIYDCENRKMVFGNYVNLEQREQRKGAKKFDPPIWDDNDYYFGVWFPTKDNTLLGQMGIWIFSSFVLLVVLFFFAYGFYIIFRQRQLSETQKQFINNMTHEFRTPISTILLSSGVLKELPAEPNPGRLQTYAKIIEEESNRLLTQVENILQATILEERKLSLNLEILDMNLLLEDICVQFRLHLAEGSLDFSRKASESMIKGDKVHLRNAIKNLLDNAVKYGGGPPVIEISTHNDGSVLQIGIKDNGIGIPRKYHKKIFRKFFRVQTGDVHDTKGFGLGLHYVKHVVELHKGLVAVESTPGLGSLFILNIPLAHGK